MDAGTDSLSADIARETGSLISTLRTAGWTLLEARCDAKTMGNWHIDLARDDLSLRLVKDRSKFFVDGPPVEELKATGLWRAFSDPAKFQEAVLKWALNGPSV